MPGIVRCCLTALALAVLGCAVTDTGPPPEAPTPPRVYLGDWDTIGIVTFEGEVDPELAGQATRRFVEMVQAAQPGARIVELGSRGAVLAEVGRDALDFEATRALGRRYGVDALFTGALELASARPRVSLGESDASLRARMDVSGELAARLTETESGALVWSRSRGGRRQPRERGPAGRRAELRRADPRGSAERSGRAPRLRAAPRLPSHLALNSAASCTFGRGREGPREVPGPGGGDRMPLREVPQWI